MIYICAHLWTGYGVPPSDGFEVVGEGEELASSFDAGPNAVFVEHFVCLVEAENPDRALEIAVGRLRAWRQREHELGRW